MVTEWVRKKTKLKFSPRGSFMQYSEALVTSPHQMSPTLNLYFQWYEIFSQIECNFLPSYPEAAQSGEIRASMSTEITSNHLTAPPRPIYYTAY